MKRKDRTAEKAAADPQAVQRGRLRAAAPFGLVFRVVLVAVSRRVLGCGARQRGALVYDKHTSWCQIIKLVFSIKLLLVLKQVPTLRSVANFF